MQGIQLVVCDLTGTTIEDSGSVNDALLTVLWDHRIAAGAQDLARWQGADRREILRFFIDRQFGAQDVERERRIERVYQDFRAVLEQRLAQAAPRVLPGVELAFAWLRERGIKIALTTGFERAIANQLLGLVGWGRAGIDASVCSDEVPQGRPAPYMIFRAMEATGVTSVQQVVVVGDTVLDLQAGGNAGARGVIGVLSGSQGAELLGRVQHTHLITSMAELPALLD